MEHASPETGRSLPAEAKHGPRVAARDAGRVCAMGWMARYWGWRLRRQPALNEHERAAITESVRTALDDSLLQHLEQPVFTQGRRFPRDAGYTVLIFRDGDRDVSTYRVDVEDCEVIGAVWHDDRHSCTWDVTVFVRGGWLTQADFATARRPLPPQVGKGHADVSSTQARRVSHDASQEGLRRPRWSSRRWSENG